MDLFILQKELRLERKTSFFRLNFVILIIDFGRVKKFKEL